MLDYSPLKTERTATMKRLLAPVQGLCALSSGFAETGVGVSIGINQPGTYGQINIGNYPPPRVINQQPIVIMPSPVREPLYLYVPPGQQNHWGTHCREYCAYGRSVYFLREDWVRERYEQDRREHGDREGDHDRGHDKRKKHRYEDN
jgi:hypothetical protein